jgi:prepilin-type N-terminal cleavage/methylation domain-containing protein
MKSNKQQGFTLIEMLVATALFIVVAFIVTTAFIVVVDAYRKSQAARLLVDNLNFAMDSMALRMREGQGYACLSTGIPCTGVTFASADGETVGYRLSNNSIERCVTTSPSCNNNDYVPIVSSAIEVTKLEFNIIDGLARRVHITIKGETEVGRDQPVEFVIQTTVSQRNYDNR